MTTGPKLNKGVGLKPLHLHIQLIFVKTLLRVVWNDGCGVARLSVYELTQTTMSVILVKGKAALRHRIGADPTPTHSSTPTIALKWVSVCTTSDNVGPLHHESSPCIMETLGMMEATRNIGDGVGGSISPQNLGGLENGCRSKSKGVEYKLV